MSETTQQVLPYLLNTMVIKIIDKLDRETSEFIIKQIKSSNNNMVFYLTTIFGEVATNTIMPYRVSLKFKTVVCLQT